MIHSKTLLIIGLIFVLLVPVVGAASQKVYALSLRYDHGTVTADNAIVTVGFFDQTVLQPQDGFFLRVASFSNQTLFTLRFAFPLEIARGSLPEWFDEFGNQIYFPNETEAGRTLLEEAITRVVVPYFKNGKTIEVLYPNTTKALDISVSHFADVCGDTVCQPHESTETCSQDCPLGADDFCDPTTDGRCDPDCSVEQDLDCQVAAPVNLLGYVIVGILVLLFVVVVYKIKSRPEATLPLPSSTR